LHVVEAHCAVLLQLARGALVIVLKVSGQAALTHFAMEIVLSASDTTYTASITVEHLFLWAFIVEEVADLTEVDCKLDLALFIGTHSL